jgi:hypothetical protein
LSVFRGSKNALLRIGVLAGAIFILSLVCFGQQPGHGFDGPGEPNGQFGPGGLGPFGPGRRGPGIPGLQVGPPGRWWDDPDLAKKVGLTADQRKKMDDIFNTDRLKLIDLFAGVQKEEAILEPLVDADAPDENNVLAQVDRLAQARADLERTVARMLLDLRLQLTHDQWVKLKAERPPLRDLRGAPGRAPSPSPGTPGGPAGRPEP